MTHDSARIHCLGSLSNFDSCVELVSCQKLYNLNTSCGDDISIFLDTSLGLVKNISMIHHGCILSKAAANALLLSIENKPKDFSLELVNQFMGLFNNAHDKCGTRLKTHLTSDLLLFEKFISYPSRIECVLLPAKIIKGWFGVNLDDNIQH